jgi:hypothetical protein
MRIYHYYGIDENGDIRPFEIISDNDYDAAIQADKMPLTMITYVWTETIKENI